MYKKSYYFELNPSEYINTVFTSIPSNAFINKGRCGLGGTTLELSDDTRCSIIVAPTIGVLKDKEKSNPTLFIVYGEIPTSEIIELLLLRKPAQKIMTTPEGLARIMDAALQVGITDKIYKTWFLLLDECHTFVTEDFRPTILTPFNYFWDFDNKAIISATPYHFSDSRFLDFDYYEIGFTDDVGVVNLVNCFSPIATLIEVINQSLDQTGKLFIFLNSVTEIREVIKRLNLQDCSIYCADDKEGKNKTKLGEYQQYFHEQPSAENYSKINFFTSRYFEGWDLNEENSTIVLVSDVHSPHTMVPVKMKLLQAAGRARKPDPKIYHLTNHRRIEAPPRSLGFFKTQYAREAEFRCKQYNELVQFWNENAMKHEKDASIERYADIDEKTDLAAINLYKVDQITNQAFTEEVYNDIDLIKKEWESGYYKVVLKKSTFKLESITTMKRKSKTQQLKEDYHAIKDSQKEDAIIFCFGKTLEERIKITNPIAYEAAKILSEDLMESIGYNVKKVKEHLILASNELNKNKMLKLIDKEFKQGDDLAKEEIKLKLQRIYNLLEFKKTSTGEICVAKATDLAEWFDIDNSKVADEKGKYTIHSYKLIRKRFALRIAA